jgi:hypothetical protein
MLHLSLVKNDNPNLPFNIIQESKVLEESGYGSDGLQLHDAGWNAYRERSRRKD